MNNNEIIRRFSKIYYDSRVWLGKTHWLGVETLKNPLDLWIFQEIIYDTKPDIIIETGTHRGGSALYMAGILDVIGNGTIITIDISNLVKVRHKRIRYLLGSSIDPVILEAIKYIITEDSTVMVVLDSNHSKEHVIKELEIYAPLVSVDKYLIVEDTNICDSIQPTHIALDAGPKEAVEEFLKNNPNFIVDTSKEKFLSTFNPGGFLKRKE